MYVQGHRISPAARRRQRRRRAAALAGLACVAAAAGVLVSRLGGPDVHGVVSAYLRAWTHDDYGRMYALLDPRSKVQLSEARFVADYRRAATTATLRSLEIGRQRSARGSVVPVVVRARTAIFGDVRQTLLVPVDTATSNPTIRFATTLLFPGLQPGERLSRAVTLPPRAALLAGDGTPLAEGPARSSPIADVAAGIVGVLGPIPAAEAGAYAAAGFPAHAKVGLDGLERVFESQLAGTPGGTLFAGRRMLAHTDPKPAPPVRTTIDPRVERAAIAALGSSYGGIAAMDPRTGAVLALVGVAFSALQPPGSTMKIITATAALQAGIVKLSTTFPIATSATIDGYTLQNAGGEACGGTFLNAFAVSCNSVFAPLGAKLGAQRLVQTAQRFGFDQPLGIPGAGESQIPSAARIGDALAVGSSAIGQGKVLASALEMTDVGATIAMGGRRPIPTLQSGQPPQFAPVTTPQVAGEVQQMMIAVVQFGTGTAAAIPGVQVAGKTGTAELANTGSVANSTKNTDAWFVGYAPTGTPRIVAGALFPNQGYGGGIAAPAVRQVLLAGLQRG